MCACMGLFLCVRTQTTQTVGIVQVTPNCDSERTLHGNVSPCLPRPRFAPPAPLPAPAKGKFLPRPALPRAALPRPAWLPPGSRLAAARQPPGAVPRRAPTKCLLFRSEWCIMVSMKEPRDLNALFSWLENQSNSSIAENLYNLLYEGGLTDAEKEYVYSIANRKRATNSTLSDDDILTDEFLEMYAEYRSLGLSSEDAAGLIGISSERMKSLLLGGSIQDRRRHAELLKIERRSDLILKKTCLTTIVRATENGNTKTAMMLLERKWPSEWSSKDAGVQTNVFVSTDDYAKKARAASERLKELRRMRREEN